MREPLQAWLRSRAGGSSTITAMERIGVGHSRAMWRLHLEDGRRLVARIEQGGVFGTSGAEEGRVMHDLAALGFPVARILWTEPTGAVLGEPFFVMEHLDGAAAADERSVDAATAAAFVAALHRLHHLDGSRLRFDVVPATPDEATHLQIERWVAVHRRASTQPVPLLEEAADWLHRCAPPLERLSVVHGDAGPGNFVHHRGEVVALTDWEFAHLGDPAEDWSFCLTMRGARTMPREEWLETFRSVAGVELPTERWRYWEVFNLFKGACANRSCLDLFERGVNPAPNMAIIGTALHQVFLRRLAGLLT